MIGATALRLDRLATLYVARPLPVNDADHARLFRAKLDGAYDWLHAPQYAAKAMKARLR